MTTTRCKFRCVSVTDHGQAKDAEFVPVSSGSDENKKYWQYTPSGSLKLGWVNPNVSFKPGQEYYLDISEAPAPEASKT